MTNNDRINALVDENAALKAEVEQLKEVEADIRATLKTANALIGKTKQRAEAAEKRADELEKENIESLRLFTNALVRKFNHTDKISKSEIVSFSARRIQKLRNQLGGE